MTDENYLGDFTTLPKQFCQYINATEVFLNRCRHVAMRDREFVKAVGGGFTMSLVFGSTNHLGN